MRKIQITFCFLFLLVMLSCNTKSNNQKELLTTSKIATNLNDSINLKFEKEKHDFGKVQAKENEYISETFYFINKGDKPIIIKKVDVTCGCVSTDFIKEPILKNNKGFVKVTLDVKQLKGYFDKKIFVESNAINDIELLHVTGTIIN